MDTPMDHHPLNCASLSPDDPRDFTATYTPTKRRTIDWRPYCRIIENQGNTNACTFYGWEGSIEVPVNLIRGTDYKNGVTMVDMDALAAFKRFCRLYYNGDESKGAYPRQVAKYMQQTGLREISPKQGNRHRLRSYWRCETLEEAENTILTVGPVTAALRVHQSFMNCGPVVPMPNRTDLFIGYHQVALVARLWQDGQPGWILRNSWGYNWADHGYAFISDHTLKELAEEMWAGQYHMNFDDQIILAERWMEL